MISTQEFAVLNNEDKQSYVLGIFSQLGDTKEEITDVVSLLESGVQFSTATLDSIFESIANSVKEGREINADIIQNQVQIIHSKLEIEAANSSSEADDILDTI